MPNWRWRVWASGCLVLESGVARRPERRLWVVRRSHSLIVALASEAVRRRWERGAGRKERAVMEISVRREGISCLEGASVVEVVGGLDVGCGKCASRMVLVERAYFILEGREGASPSSETWNFWTGASRPLQRRSQIWTLPSRLQVARTLEESDWKRVCFREDEWPAMVYTVRWVGMSMTWPVWSPDAVARSKSLGEKARSRIALEWGLNVRYAFRNSGLAVWSVSRSLTPPSSSPIATREFAGKHY